MLATMQCNNDMPTGILQFVTEPENQVGVIGGNAQFNCSVQSDHLITSTWEFVQRGSVNSQVIADLTGPVVPEKYSVINIGPKSSRLEVHWIQELDAGRYVCRVTSGNGGTIQADAELVVLRKYNDCSYRLNCKQSPP